MSFELTPKSRLHGKAVFLSASVPSPDRHKDYQRILEAPLRIEEAVICLARAIFIEGGTLVLGGHPSISPLVARVIDNYYLPAPAEDIGSLDKTRGEPRWRNPSVVIYQSEVWRPFWAEVTEQLSRHPLVTLRWIAAVEGETVNLDVKDWVQAPKSMARMRAAMIKETEPLAMVAIGGMEGVEDEALLFAELFPDRPIFSYVTTGGASALLSERHLNPSQFVAVDSEAGSLVRSFWKKQAGNQSDNPAMREADREFYVPYALVAQQIIARIVDSLEGPHRAALQY